MHELGGFAGSAHILTGRATLGNVNLCSPQLANNGQDARCCPEGADGSYHGDIKVVEISPFRAFGIDILLNVSKRSSIPYLRQRLFSLLTKTASLPSKESDSASL
jgi:hypothetical protein